MRRKRAQRRRVSRVIRARLGYFVGVLILAVGFGLALGPGWGLVAAGLGTVVSFVFLYDVDEAAAEPEEVRLR